MYDFVLVVVYGNGGFFFDLWWYGYGIMGDVYVFEYRIVFEGG